MGDVFDYSIPVLHPIVVHFPIVLTIAAAFCAWVWLGTDRFVWLLAVIWLTAAGFAGALAAYFTGEEMEEQSEGVPVVETFVERHETLGLTSTIVLGVLVLISLFVHRRASRDVLRTGGSAQLRWTIAVLLTIAAFLVGLTAHLGGLMVWGVAR